MTDLSPAIPDALDQEEFLDRVKPPGWKNPEPKGVYDLVIVGAGPAGLSGLEVAVRLGLSVALVERDRIGGNSLNSGSVPSKTIVRSALVFGLSRRADEFGASAPLEPDIDFASVMERMRRARTRIAEYHSADRIRRRGADLFFGICRFTGPNALNVGDMALSFRKALIATGARPRPSNIPGLDRIGYFTSASILDTDALPKRLAIIGGGPLGCESAQAFCRLGAHVTIVQNNPKFLPDEERDAAELLSRSLSRDGVVVRLNTTVTAARMENGVKILETTNNEVQDIVEADEVMLSIGRIANVEDLGLETAGIDCVSKSGIKVDDHLRTTNPDVYAAGDVCTVYKFTNVAEATGRMAVENAFDRHMHRKNQQSHLQIPWCTFCDPEIAHIGMQVWEARERSIPVTTFTVMMQDVDRAIVDGEEQGFVKIHVKDGSDEILGATIVAARASEMINEMSVILGAGIGMRELAGILHTYPAQSEAIRLAALAFVRDQPGLG